MKAGDIEPLGWGLIGASDVAHRRMIGAINAQSDSKVVAVMSHQLERGQQFAREHNIPKNYNTLKDILSDREVEIVYISTTNERHKAETIAAAEVGKHVLCEKPLALTIDDALEMVAACSRAGVVMGTNHHLRNSAIHRTLRRLIAKGNIGIPLAACVFHAFYLRPLVQTWRIKQPEAGGGGVVLDITTHDADILRFVLNDNAKEVMAFTAQQGMATKEPADAVMGVMRFQSGILAQFHDAFTTPHAVSGLQIHGTEASLITEDVMGHSTTGHIYLQHNGQRTIVETGPSENLDSCTVRNFNLAVRGKGLPTATGVDGLYSLAVALAVSKSAQTGQKVAVPYPL